MACRSQSRFIWRVRDETAKLWSVFNSQEQWARHATAPTLPSEFPPPELPSLKSKLHQVKSPLIIYTLSYNQKCLQALYRNRPVFLQDRSRADWNNELRVVYVKWLQQLPPHPKKTPSYLVRPEAQYKSYKALLATKYHLVVWSKDLKQNLPPVYFCAAGQTLGLFIRPFIEKLSFEEAGTLKGPIFNTTGWRKKETQIL